MFKRREIISAFDIEGDLVKLAQIGIEDTRKFLYRLTARKAQGDPDGLVNAVRKLAGEYKVAGTRVIVSIPRHNVTVRNLKLPSVNPSEIENMVELQAAKQLPFPPDKIISSYRILGKDKSGYSDVMIVLAHRDIADKILNIFNKAGIDIERLALSSEALCLLHMERQKEDEKKTPACLVDIGKALLEVQIVREGKIDFTRSINFSSPHNMETRMADEIRKSIFTYQKAAPGLEVSKLILTGRRSAVSKEAPQLRNNIDLPTVYIDTLKAWPTKDDAALPSEGELSSESFTAVLSLAFNYDKLETNLIPKEIRYRNISRLFRERLIMAGVLFLCLLMGVMGIVAKNFLDKKRFLASIDRKLEATKPKVEELTRFKEITELIKRQSAITGTGIDVIRELYELIPPEISLTILDYEDGHSCLLRGASEGLSDVFKFISTLEESLYFENVKVRYATKRIVDKKEVTDFEIIALLTHIKTY